MKIKGKWPRLKNRGPNPQTFWFLIEGALGPPYLGAPLSCGPSLSEILDTGPVLHKSGVSYIFTSVHAYQTCIPTTHAKLINSIVAKCENVLTQSSWIGIT